MNQTILWMLLLAAGVPTLVAQTPDVEVEPEIKGFRFAVIGDYGSGYGREGDMADLIADWGAEFILTLGDNNYPNGEASTIDRNVGQFFHDYIKPYTGSYGPGSPDVNRFFPSLGNHDWRAAGAQPYLNYFTLPGNERYYDVVWENVHLFALDSDENEPDGITFNSIQGQWLKTALTQSQAQYKIVYFHNPGLSSGQHGPYGYMEWPFAEWGASVVMAGHDHLYERILRQGFPQITNGLGSISIYVFENILEGSEVRYNADYGAILAEAQTNALSFWFVTNNRVVVDTHSIPKDGPPLHAYKLIGKGANWKYLDDGSDQGTAWRASAFDDSGWASGDAELGYGDGDEITTVGYGPNGNDKYITTYFRHTFEFPANQAMDHVMLRLKRDDGGVVYLNGTEVLRDNMPGGNPNYNTLASSSISSVEETNYVETLLDPADFVVGSNTLAVEIHQEKVNSPDISFDLELIGTRTRGVLVPKESTWRYLDTGIDPGSAWASRSFDDTNWSTGTGQFGYGEGDEATVVSFGGNANDKHATTYFRTYFLVNDPQDIRGVQLNILRDDGAIAYLNGKEVYRSNLTMDAVDNETFAAWDVGGSEENDYILTGVNHSWLRTGINVMAVEVHQQSASNQDLSFDAELLVIEK